jgi:hypothetical protein
VNSSDLAQQGIADLVPVTVIDLFEPVDVEEHQGNDAPITASARNRVLEAVGKQGAVDQAGERIVAGQEVEPLLVELTFEGVRFGALFPAGPHALGRGTEQEQRFEGEKDDGGSEQEILRLLEGPNSIGGSLPVRLHNRRHRLAVAIGCGVNGKNLFGTGDTPRIDGDDHRLGRFDEGSESSPRDGEGRLNFGFGKRRQ